MTTCRFAGEKYARNGAFVTGLPASLTGKVSMIQTPKSAARTKKSQRYVTAKPLGDKCLSVNKQAVDAKTQLH